MCPGSPDRGRNACVEGPSVLTEVDGLLCASVSFSLEYIVAKTTFSLKRWIQRMLSKDSSQNSLQEQWTFEPLPAARTSEEPTLPQMNVQYFIFPSSSL